MASTHTLPIPGQTIHVFVNGAVGHSCVCVQTLHGVVRSETEKALKIEALDERANLTGRLCWFPKKAFKVDKKDKSLSLAHWFKPQGYTGWFVETMSIVSGVSA